MTDHYSHLIASKVEPSGRIEVCAPYDLNPIASVDSVDGGGIEQALQVAYKQFRHRDSWLSKSRRIEILNRAAEIMQAQAGDLALEAAREGGKPLIDSRVEVSRAIDGIRICIETLRSDAGRVVPMGVNPSSDGRLAFTTQEPIGVVVALSAFNHPLNLIVHQVAPAVAVGCPVIVKPASDTPLSCLRFIRILREAGLPETWAQALLTRDHSVTGRLIADSRVALLSFIGSARVGWRLRSSLAAGTRCVLEHGGVAPVIVAEDAEVETMLPLLAKGGFYHAGQVCVSVQRIFVHESRVDQVAEGLVETARNMTIGDPTLPATEIGPLIRPAEVERVDQWVEEAVAAGAQRLCGGARHSQTCYQATLLLDAPHSCRISQEEVFGPVISLYTYRDLDEAINRANSLPFAFQAAIFTQGLDRAMRASRRLDASTVMVNDHTAFRVDWMPFAGLRESGLGVGGIPYTMHDMQVDKLIVFKSKEL
ncbi:MAG: aldehyde dehydrogenase family protein [Chromatiales bacterium]|jgi:acyl-CoA reductase-like NAD-dependent aldehyde dehydrogenase